MLPHSVAFNVRAAAEGSAKLARALGVQDAGLGLFELAKGLGVPTALSEIGMLMTPLS